MIRAAVAACAIQHGLAFYLAIEHTKLEIDLLYSDAVGVEIYGLKVGDIFKMDGETMMENNIIYDGNI